MHCASIFCNGSVKFDKEYSFERRNIFLKNLKKWHEWCENWNEIVYNLFKLVRSSVNEKVSFNFRGSIATWEVSFFFNGELLVRRSTCIRSKSLLCVYQIFCVYHNYYYIINIFVKWYVILLFYFYSSLYEMQFL